MVTASRLVAVVMATVLRDADAKAATAAANADTAAAEAPGPEAGADATLNAVSASLAVAQTTSLPASLAMTLSHAKRARQTSVRKAHRQVVA